MLHTTLVCGIIHASGTNLGEINVFGTNKLREYVTMLAPDNGNGGGGSSGGGTSGNQAPPNPPVVVDDNEEEDDELDDDDDDEDDDEDSDNADGDPEKAFKKLLARFGGDGVRAAEQLFREAHANRASKRLLREQVANLKRQLPRKGSVLLQKGPARQYRDFQALNLTPAQIRASLQELDTLRGSQAETTRDQQLAKVAEVTKFNVDALKQLGGELEYDIQEVTVNGQTVRNASVVKRIKNGANIEVQRIPVDKYAEENWSVFLPALRATPDGGGSDKNNGQRTGRFVRQAPGGSTGSQSNGGGSGGYAAKYRERHHPKPQTDKK